MRADPAGLEGVELGGTFVATPDGADRRRGPATGTREPLAPRNFFELAQGPGGFEAAPAVHAGISGDEAGPYGAGENGENDEPGYSEEA